MSTLRSSHLPVFFHHKKTAYTAANAVIYHLLKLFIQDCKDLVQSTVQQSIKVQLRSPHEVTRKHGMARNAALKAWLSLDNPLTYGNGTSDNRGGYRFLLVILDEDPHNMITDLQTTQEQFTYHEMGMIIYTAGSITGNLPRTMSAPIVRSGSFLPALPLGFAHIRQVTSLGEEHKEILAALIARMVRKMEIQIVPWHRGDRPGSRSYTTRGDWWMKIKHTGTTDLETELQRDQPDEQGVLVTHALDHNIDAPWSMPLALHKMGPLWNKSTLPSQWGLEYASLPTTGPGDDNHYVKETYEYVRDVYDGRIWWHHLGLVWGIMFSKTAPFLCFSKDITLQATESISRLTKEVQQIPWIKSTSKTHRGITSPMPFITMMSTAIISLLDSRSPLRRRMRNHNNSMGSVWTKKHGMKQNDYNSMK